MARSSIGFLGIFGRSEDLRALDRALRDLDIHPRLVTEAVKLAAVSILRDHRGEEPPAAAYAATAEMIGYCLLGADAFAAANGAELTGRVEARIEAALAAGGGLDSRLLLLAIHARFIQPSVVEAFGLEISGS